jgi:hypothetical protein
VRAEFVIPGVLQVGFFCRSCRKLPGFLCFLFPKAAMFVGVGHWLHDTPPIFQVRQCAFLGFVPVSEAGRIGCEGAIPLPRPLRVKRDLFSLQISNQFRYDRVFSIRGRFHDDAH